MRNILALVGAATLTFLIVGWYLGWYEISGVPGPGGRQSVSVELHPGKVTKDVGVGLDRLGEAADSLRDKAKSDKPAPLTTPQGPASRFFGPEPAPATKPTSTNGWRPLTPDR